MPSPLMTPSISTFEQFIAPMSAHDFLEGMFGKSPVYLRGPADRFTHLLTWDALNSLLSQHPTDSLNIRLVKEGQTVPADKYVRAVNIEFFPQHRQVDLVEITKLFREGATLTLDVYPGVHEPIRSLANILQDTLFSRVHVVVFAGWHSTRCFDTHWDPTDIFVLQIFGRKHWRVLEPTRLHPVFEDRRLSLDPPKDPYWEGDLNPGDLLHVPRGWWHAVTPYSEPSLHLTFVVKPATGLDLAQAVLNHLKEVDFIRANVPLHATEAEQLRYMESFRSAVNAAAASISLASFHAELNSRLPSRPRLSLPWSAVPDSQAIPESAHLEWLPARAAIATEYDHLRVQMSNSTFILPTSIIPVVTDLIHKKAITLKNLQTRHPHLDVVDCVLHLISKGLVSITASHSPHDDEEQDYDSRM